MLKGLPDPSPASPMGQGASLGNGSDFRIVCRPRLVKELINLDVAVVGQYTRSREEAIAAIVRDDLSSDVVVEGNALKTVHLLQGGF